MSTRTRQLENTFYKKSLPTVCIAFDSNHGKQLFREAMDEGNMDSYFALSMQYLTQSEPAFCGLGTLCMILNAFGIDPLRQWKGPWRWYDESMLNCCRPLDVIKVRGVHLDEFVCIAKCNRLKTRLFRPNDTTKEQFISHLKQSCQSSNEYMVISYFRGALNQTGTGHFSPIAGYNQKEGKALVLDVARFKYPAYWVSVDLLWESMIPIDEATGMSRGYVLMSPGKSTHVYTALSQLSCDKDSWKTLSESLFESLPKTLLQLPPSSGIEQYISTVIASIPDKYLSVVEGRIPLFMSNVTDVDAEEQEVRDGLMQEYIQSLDSLLQQLSRTKLYKIIANSVATKNRLVRIMSTTDFEPTTISELSPAVKSPTVLVFSRLSSIASLENSLSQVDCEARRSTAEQRVKQLLGEPVSDFVAFLTMFLFALFMTQKNDLHCTDCPCEPTRTTRLTLSPTLIHILRNDMDHVLSHDARTEIFLLQEQIEALMDLDSLS